SPHHLCKGLRVRSQGREERIGLLDLCERALLRLRALRRTAEQARRHLASGQRWGRRWAGSCCSRGAAWVAQLAVPPGGQDPRHAPVPPTAALGAHLVPELRRAVLSGLPALLEIHPIRRDTTAIARAPLAFGEALAREPIAQGALRHPDLLRDDRPGVACIPERPGALVLRPALGPPGHTGDISAALGRGCRRRPRAVRPWGPWAGSGGGGRRCGCGSGGDQGRLGGWQRSTATASRRCFSRCQRSATCTASGAPWVTPEAYASARSRATTVTSGCARSQAATVSAKR